MSRGLSAPNVTASTALHVRPIAFIKLEFDSATLYLHNGVGSYVWGSQTWLGIGALGQISPLEEGHDLSPLGVTLQLTAFDATVLNEAINEEVFNRRVTLYIGLLDDNGVLTDTPFERWSGWMDSMPLDLGGDNDAITLQCESDLRFFNQANGARFTDEDQQARYSGDLMFEYLAQMIDAQVVWGPGGQYQRFGDRRDTTLPPVRPPGPFIRG